MNKAAIQRFAMKARTDLIGEVQQRAYQYGITKEGFGDANAVTVGGRALNTEEQRQRRQLVEQIQRKGYTQVMEEVAYTWFNRFIALRFMEVNSYLPSHIRVFSDSTGAFKPEILNDVLHLDLPGLNAEKVAAFIESNQTEDLYRYLLLTQCNALNDALPQMFEQMGGYTELLLPNNILKQDSVLGRMVTDIDEEDWTDQVQIIGWLYQYYNSELKDDTFALLKKNVKITKERIPSATQLFTPDWIVRYMVENSLGRIYIDKRKNAGIYGDGRGLDEMTWEEAEAGRIATEKELAAEMDWKYYLPEAEQSQEVRKQLDEIQLECDRTDVKDIKVIDPCMGSGHILVYAFDVLMQIYEANGYNQRDAVQSILENNLYGLDIDDRAAQLAYFAVMMKARQYDRRIFSRGIQPHVHTIVESNGINRNHLKYMGDNIKDKSEWQKDYDQLCFILDFFRDAKEYGSILNPVRSVDYRRLCEFRENYHVSDISFDTLDIDGTSDALFQLITQYAMMSQKYDVVVTNPPYRALADCSDILYDFAKNNYSRSKNDLSTVFMERTLEMCKPTGFMAMINIPVWMSKSSFEDLRNMLLVTNTFINMLHCGRGIFGSDFGTTAFVIARHFISAYKAVFHQLFDEMGAVDSVEQKELWFHQRKGYYAAQQRKFLNIASYPIAYSTSEKLLNILEKEKPLSAFANPRKGLTTGDNDTFARLWFEVSKEKFSILSNGTKWYPMTKGGDFRRWYGNNEYVVNWENDGYEIKHFKDEKGKLRSRPQNTQFYFQEGISWNDTTATGKIAFRYQPEGYISNASGPCVFADHNLIYLFGLLNSVVSQKLLEILAPNMKFEVGQMALVPIILKNDREGIERLVHQTVSIVRRDWDAFEASWDFSVHPLVHMREGLEDSVSVAAAMQQFYGELPKVSCPLELCYLLWQGVCNDRFKKLKANEEELNRIFIDIYGLQDELTPEVSDDDVTVRLADKKRDIRSLISYAVGCMFGRYSLDVPGLSYAGGDWDDGKYSTYLPDKDNIIPICDDDYFDDDITGRFMKWVETVYGSETLEENLKFIADALGGKGTSREVIRSYFLNDFYADHLKIYQKRPIYWLFDSGKKNGFKALIYMHRYQSDLLARMRTDYVHEQQERYRTQLTHLADAIDHASASERVKLTKQQKKLQEQSLEIQKYEEKIHHLADQNIQIDLDDGVNHNYELFAEVLAKRK